MSTAQTTSRIFQFPNFLSIANRLNGAFLHAPYRSQSRCSHTAEVWLLRSWEARNINKKKLLLSVDIHRWECNHCCFKFFFFFIYASLNTSSGNIPPRDPSTLQADSMWCEATPNSGYLIRPSPYVSMKGPSWRSWQHMLRTYQLSFSVSTIQPIAWASKYCKATPRYLTPFCY